MSGRASRLVVVFVRAPRLGQVKSRLAVGIGALSALRFYREITARVRVENDWIVESGLAAGERVVVEGTQKVRPGMAVKPVSVAAAGAPAAPAQSPAPGQAPAPADGKGGK